MTGSGNLQNGGFSETTSGGGSYSLSESGTDDSTPFSISHNGTTNFSQSQSGNAVDGQLSFSQSGTNRYDLHLLEQFNNPSEAAQGMSGVAKFSPVGMPVELGVAPNLTGTFSTPDARHRYCFAAGTQVLLADGTTRSIEKMEVGMMVLAVPEDDPEAAPTARKVLEVYHNAPARLLEVHVRAGNDSTSDVIRTTANHPFYVQNKGWVFAEALTQGDQLRTHTGKSWDVTLVRWTDAIEPVFNIHVEASRTYFVASSAGRPTILVHNQSGGTAVAQPKIGPSPVTEGPLWTPDVADPVTALQREMAPAAKGSPSGAAGAAAAPIVASWALAFIPPPGQQDFQWLSNDHYAKVLRGLVLSGQISDAQARWLGAHIAYGNDKTTVIMPQPGVEFIGWTANGQPLYKAPRRPMTIDIPKATAKWDAWLAQAKKDYAAAKKAAAEAQAAAAKPAPTTQPAATQPAASGSGNGAPPTTTTAPSTRPGKNIVDIVTVGKGYTPEEIADIKEYVRRTNQWLAANPNAIVQTTTGKLRREADQAAKIERDAATARGKPYKPYPDAQVGHVPDTALTGLPNPPGVRTRPVKPIFNPGLVFVKMPPC